MDRVAERKHRHHLRRAAIRKRKRLERWHGRVKRRDGVAASTLFPYLMGVRKVWAGFSKLLLNKRAPEKETR